MKVKSLINQNKWDDIFHLVKGKKLDPSEEIVNGNNIVHLASINNNKQIVRHIIKSNPILLEKSNNDGNHIGHLLAQYGYSDLLKECIDSVSSLLYMLNRKKENITNIVYSDYDLIKYIFTKIKPKKSILSNDKYGENIISKNIDESTKKNDDSYKIINILLQHEGNEIINFPGSFLCHTIFVKKDYLSHLFLENNYDINKKDEHFNTPILHSLIKNNLKISKVLLEKGADINYCGAEGDNNPLIYAVKTINTEMVEFLLENNFNVDSYNRFIKTALHYSLNKKYHIPYSLNAKIVFMGDLNVKNIYNITPLHLLCRYFNPNHYDSLLVNKELDIFVRDNYDKRPIDYIHPTYINTFLDIISTNYINGIEKYGEKSLSERIHLKGNDKTTCRKHKDYKKCKDILKKYIFKTNSSILSREDIPNISKKIDFIVPKETNYTLFGSDPIHNMIYTVHLLNKYKNLGVPFQYYSYDKFMNDLIHLKGNNLYFEQDSGIIVDLVTIYQRDFYEIQPYLVVWKDKNVNYIHPDLKLYVEKCLDADFTRYIMFKLTLIPGSSGTHANIIIYDKEKKTLERYEPYGIIPYVESDELNIFLKEEFKKVLGDFEFYSPNDINSGVGLQVISGDSNYSLTNYGDPGGFCLAWTFWYLEMRIKNPDIHPKELIKHCYQKIPGLELNKDPKKLVLSYIRGYAKELDDIKNKFMVSAGINEKNIYEHNLSIDDHRKIVKRVESEIQGMIKKY